MPVEKTKRSGFNVVDGACFAYYDETFKECLECDYGNECKKATSCDDVKNIRKEVKNDLNSINELVKRFK